MRHGFHAGQVDWPRDVSHGSTNESSWVQISYRWYVDLLVGPRPLVLFRECAMVFCFFFAVFCGVRAKKTKRKAQIRTLTCLCRPTKHLPASARRLAVPPSAATTAEVVDLPAGAAIRGLLLLALRRMRASSPAKKLSTGVTCINFLFESTCSFLFAFWSYVAGISCVRTRT